MRWDIVAIINGKLSRINTIGHSYEITVKVNNLNVKEWDRKERKEKKEL